MGSSAARQGYNCPLRLRMITSATTIATTYTMIELVFGKVIIPSRFP